MKYIQLKFIHCHSKICKKQIRLTLNEINVMQRIYRDEITQLIVNRIGDMTDIIQLYRWQL